MDQHGAIPPLSVPSDQESIEWTECWSILNQFTSSARDSGHQKRAKKDSHPHRTLWWKLYFGVVPRTDVEAGMALLITSNSDTTITTPENAIKREEAGKMMLASLAQARAEYRESQRSFHHSAALESTSDDPLSLEGDSNWSTHFKDQQLRKLIEMDVVRAFPEDSRFREAHIQRLLTNVLFIWSKQNPDTSYRQGMHELAGMIYLCVAADADLRWKSIFCRMCYDPTMVDVDVGLLFNQLMISAKKWYRVETSTHKDLMPIVSTCNRIQGDHLKAIDSDLYLHLKRENVSPQVYGIRWIRLLFSREFSMEKTLQLWDAIFAFDANLSLVEWIATAVLLAKSTNLNNLEGHHLLQLLTRPLEGIDVADVIENAIRYCREYTILESRMASPFVPSSRSPSINSVQLSGLGIKSPSKGINLPRLDDIKSACRELRDYASIISKYSDVDDGTGGVEINLELDSVFKGLIRIANLLDPPEANQQHSKPRTGLGIAEGQKSRLSSDDAYKKATSISLKPMGQPVAERFEVDSESKTALRSGNSNRNMMSNVLRNGMQTITSVFGQVSSMIDDIQTQSISNRASVISTQNSHELVDASTSSLSK